VQFQKISIPIPWMDIGNSEGVGHLKKIVKESMKLNWNFQRGGEGGVQTKKPPAREGRRRIIFWNHTLQTPSLLVEGIFT